LLAFCGMDSVPTRSDTRAMLCRPM
jgi:hypothetical protein